ncbi:MAG: HNH endonuclease [Sinimarinibacterium flocculans]|uniref:HNH endonuclease n=1 Tax=Sinimarinibacterium flocculans TaxID=985250 RepID=UPI003C598CF6
MPTKPLDRLMFAQGGLCFFCNVPLPKAEASVEHLVALARNGTNGDDNCVACCKAMNALLGSMSLKEKIKVVLNQKGQFKCPNGAGCTPAKPQSSSPTKPRASSAENEALSAVIANLKGRGNARPRRMKTLVSTIRALPLKLSGQQVSAVIQQLQSNGKIVVDGTQVSYKL